MSMINASLIGIGAGGNKATVLAIEKEVIDMNNAILLNTTDKDIPEAYKELATIFGNVKGCAKERKLAEKQMLKALKNKNIPLPITKETKVVIIVTTAEGGTGSGSSVLLGKYISQVYKLHVIFAVLTGFEDDPHGMKNTIDWFKDLSKEFTVMSISNKKFLEEAEGNRTKAEELANEEFVNRLSIILGNDLKASDTNIDETDLFKLITRPGYMTVEASKLYKVKDSESLNDQIEIMLENSKSLDSSQSAKSLGVILNASSKTRSYLDREYTPIIRKYGTVYEKYTHLQDDKDDEYICVIVSGMKLPKDEIKEIHTKFTKNFQDIDTSEDDFFTKEFDTNTKELNVDILGTEFDQSDIDDNESDFFKSMDMDDTNDYDFDTILPKKEL